MSPPLRELARAAGLDADYTSWRGEPTSASDESVRLALRALGPGLGVDLERDDALALLEQQRWREVVPPVVLAWDGRMVLPFSVPAEVDQNWECEVTLEGGGSVRAQGRLFD